MDRSGSGAERSGEKRAYRSRDERRAEIVAATLAILAEEGMHAWTTSALADRVGVSEATLFKHFEDKNEILTEALRQQAGALRRHIRDHAGAGSGWERARGLILRILDAVEEAEGGPLVILLGHAIRIHPAMGHEVERTAGLLRERLRELLSEDSAGGPAERNAAAVADLLIAVGQSSALRWVISGRRGSPAEIARPMLDLVEACLDREEGA